MSLMRANVLILVLLLLASQATSFKPNRLLYKTLVSGNNQEASLSATITGTAVTTTTVKPGGGDFKNAAEVKILRDEALKKILGNISEDYSFEPTTGGVNNIMDYVTTADGKKYVLRIYNNGRDSVRVDFEDRVLSAIIANGGDLSFKVPTAIPSAIDGKKHVLLSNGAEAILFEFIPGELPKKRWVREIGRASGELVAAMGKISVDMKSPNPRFCELFKAHHATTRDNFFEELKKPCFDVTPTVRQYVNLLGEEVLEIEAKIARMQTMSLPVQLIHADLHYDNVLVHEERVSGLLDFEFSVHDWRACELAVSLSKYAGEADALRYFTEFCNGYTEHGRLSAAEISCIPDLIILRILSNVVYFVGRAMAGEDSIDSLTTRAEMYYNRIKWIKERENDIVNIVKCEGKMKV